ncbi:hypothetical protein D3C80_1853510 [compost metagenome]
MGDPEAQMFSGPNELGCTRRHAVHKNATPSLRRDLSAVHGNDRSPMEWKHDDVCLRRSQVLYLEVALVMRSNNCNRAVGDRMYIVGDRLIALYMRW